MSQDTDPTRRLLAPRERRARVAVAAPPSPAAPRKGWLTAVAIAALGGALASGWVWHASVPAVPVLTAPAATSTPTPTSPGGPPDASAPLASINELLSAPAAREWRWHRLRDNPAILAIEFPGLTEQGQALNRMAAMYEKRDGSPDRVLTDTQMSQLLLRSGDSVASFYQGHDYTADQLARFFSLAAAQRVPLTAQESRLLVLLVDAAVLKPTGPLAYSALGLQAVISFTAVQPDDPATAADEAVDGVRRASVLLHEVSHGEFFTNAAYRAHSWAFWRERLTEPERQTFRRYLDGLGYNAGDEELMVNETQAVLMHTPDKRAFNAAALDMTELELEGLRVRFRRELRSFGIRTAPAR